jgi:hypothetical protein
MYSSNCLILIIDLNFDRSEASSQKVNNLLEIEEGLNIERVTSDGVSLGKFTVSKNSLACNECIDEPGSCCRTCTDQISSFLRKGQSVPNLSTIKECIDEKWPEKYEHALKEGCRVKGQILISRLPGEFHFSVGRSRDINGTHVHDISLFRGHSFDFSHKINSLSFGSYLDNDVLGHPLNGVMSELNSDENITFNYYLKLVPFLCKYRNKKITSGFHLSATRHQKKNLGESALPIIVFNYEFSAISLVQAQVRRPFSSFITGMCAIIGGIYTLSALLDSCMYSVERSIKHKNNYGKTY